VNDLVRETTSRYTAITVEKIYKIETIDKPSKTNKCNI